MKKQPLVILLVIVLVTLSSDMMFAQETTNLYTLKLTTLDNRIEDLISNKVTLMYLTRPGCPYCEAFEANALPRLLELLNEHPEMDFVTVAYGNEEEIREKYEAAQFRVLLGTDELKELIGFKGYPSFFWIAGDGDIKNSKIGFSPTGTLEDLHFITEYVNRGIVAKDSLNEEATVDAVAGALTVDDLNSGKTVMVFFLPENCPACEIVDNWFADSIGFSADINVAFVTSRKTDALADWIQHHQDRNVFVDTSATLASKFRVSQVPSVYFVDEGQVLFRDVWPFHNGLDGLEEMLELFESGLISKKTTPYLVGQKLAELGLTDNKQIISESTLRHPALIFFYSPACEPSSFTLGVIEQVFSRSDLKLPSIYIAYPGEHYEQSSISTSLSNAIIFDGTELMRILDITSSPTLLLLDSNGYVVWHKIGYNDQLEDVLLEQLRALD